ncbi:hypothetical protein [Fibrobacter sp.]|uniref:hypothetical protein n=1 Tax=Fibrobacter sp. TaxID=35828 RepID=UPI00388F08AB
MRKFTLFAILSVLAALFVACDDSSSGASNADEQAEAISSESTTDKGISSAEDAILYSSNADDEGSSSNTEEVIESSSSSEATQENMSSEVNENFSSEVQSSSSETQSSSSEDVYLIYDRTLLYRYNGDTSEVQEAGRFYIVFENAKCKSRVTYEGMQNYGVEYVGNVCESISMGGVNKGKDIKFFRSTKDIKKHVLDSLIEGFFNSFTVDDTSKIEIEFDPRDWQETVRICDEEKNCHYETIEKDSVELRIDFWEDVSVERCKQIIDSCEVSAPEGCKQDYSTYVFTKKNTIESLESSRDIMYIKPARDEEPL